MQQSNLDQHPTLADVYSDFPTDGLVWGNLIFGDIDEPGWVWRGDL